jgi:hypothetical protein
MAPAAHGARDQPNAYQHTRSNGVSVEHGGSIPFARAPKPARQRADEEVRCRSAVGAPASFVILRQQPHPTSGTIDR